MTRSHTGTTDRGYGIEHKRKRAEWAPVVATGQARCHAKRCLHPSRAIDPDEAWDLGHNESRTRWTGPEHARCNRSEGATRGNKQRKTLASTPNHWEL
jgi:hypothetical protein